MNMDPSTPMIEHSTPLRTNDLRRRTLLQNAAASVSSPLRRASAILTPIIRRSTAESLTSPLRKTSPIKTPQVQIQLSDESERSSRRSLVHMQRTISNIPQPQSPLNESTKFLGEQDMKDHFQICTKLYTENKINTKNAWQLHIIDLLRHMSQKQSGDNLQVASTSLDISAKVYGIRVDDVHTDGLKLASNMARASEKHAPAGGDNEDGDDAPEGAENEKVTAKKKKKRRFLTGGEKNTITKDPKTLITPLPKLESVFFSTRTDTEASSIDNLFTNMLKMDNTGYKFMLLSKDRAWADKPDPLVSKLSDENRKKHTLTVNPVKNFKLCQPFSDFHVDEWDADEEEKQLAADKSKVNAENSMVNEVIYDENGIPIPELDGAIPDIFADNIDDDDDINNDDVIEEQERDCGQIRTNIEHIVDFQPEEVSRKSEYSYNSIITSHSGKYLDRIWAGPSHWKLKYIKRNTPRFSGQATQNPEKPASKPGPKKKKEIGPCLFDDDDTFVPFDFTKKYNEKRRTKGNDIQKITLPEYPDASCEELFRPELISRNVAPMRLRETAETKKNTQEVEVGEYNYENPSDSQYCSQPAAAENDDDCPMDNDDHGGEFDHEPEEIMAVAAQQNFLDENLVDCPESVPRSYVPYALQAKKMDMRKLKTAVWQNLTKTTEVPDKNTQQRTGKVIPTTFSKMYKELPKLISEKMRSELSCPLAYVALLHLCNEQNLELKQHPDFNDFDILGPEKEGSTSHNDSRMDWM